MKKITKDKKKQLTNFYQVFISSLDGHTRQQQARACLLGALILLILWTVLSSSGAGRVFTTIDKAKEVFSTAGMAKEAYTQFEAINQNPNAQDSSFFSWPFSQEEPKENEMSPFMRSVIANIGAILAMILFLALMAKVSKQKSDFQDSVITVAVYYTPLTIGMLISYIFFKLAEGVGEGGDPTNYYSIAVGVLVPTMMTSLIVLYVNVMSIMQITARKRYITTIIAPFVSLGVFGWILKGLSS